MIRAVSSTALALLLATSCTVATAACDVAWRFTPQPGGASPHIDAEVAWRAGNSTTSELTLTDSWGGVDTFVKSIRDFRAQSSHQWVLDRADPARKTVTHLPGERVVVRYTIDTRPSAPDRDPITRRDAYGAIVGPDWFHFVGYAVFAVPARFGDETRPRMCVTIDGIAAEGWIVSSFDVRRARNTTFTLRDSPARLRHAVYFGGRFEVRERRVRGHPIWIARHGTWMFDMDEYAAAVEQVVASQRAFWNDFDFPPLVVELLHTNRPASLSGGTALTNAFLMYAPADFALAGEAFTNLLSHEHLHTWLPRRFGSMGENEPLRYWFSEGFTDFYTHRLLVLSGVWSLDQYARTMNARIEQYLQSDARSYDNERVKASFFADPAAGALPYQRGELLATRWHAALSADGEGGLDDLMRSTLLPYSVEEDAKPPAPLATKRLIEALEARGLSHARADVERYIDRGESMELGANALGPCFEMALVDKPAFALGFDRNSVRDGRLIGVDVDGPAYAAGLRDGQAINGFGLYEGDVSRDVYVQLRDDRGLTSEVRFLPISRDRIHLPVYATKPGADSDPACRAWFGLDRPITK